MVTPMATCVGQLAREAVEFGYKPCQGTRKGNYYTRMDGGCTVTND